MSKSPCDTCRDPGYCCSALTLSTVFPAKMPRDKVAQHVAEGTDPYGYGNDAEPTPQFHPLRVTGRYAKRGQKEADGVTWMFSCDWLGADGRCMNYENRPKLCAGYEPKADPLCIEYDGSWKGFLQLYREE